MPAAPVGQDVRTRRSPNTPEHLPAKESALPRAWFLLPSAPEPVRPSCIASRILQTEPLSHSADSGSPLPLFLGRRRLDAEGPIGCGTVIHVGVPHGIKIHRPIPLCQKADLSLFVGAEGPGL